MSTLVVPLAILATSFIVGLGSGKLAQRLGRETVPWVLLAPPAATLVGLLLLLAVFFLQAFGVRLLPEHLGPFEILRLTPLILFLSAAPSALGFSVANRKPQ